MWTIDVTQPTLTNHVDLRVSKDKDKKIEKNATTIVIQVMGNYSRFTLVVWP